MDQVEVSGCHVIQDCSMAWHGVYFYFNPMARLVIVGHIYFGSTNRLTGRQAGGDGVGH